MQFPNIPISNGSCVATHYATVMKHTPLESWCSQLSIVTSLSKSRPNATEQVPKILHYSWLLADITFTPKLDSRQILSCSGIATLSIILLKITKFRSMYCDSVSECLLAATKRGVLSAFANPTQMVLFWIYQRIWLGLSILKYIVSAPNMLHRREWFEPFHHNSSSIFNKMFNDVWKWSLG